MGYELDTDIYYLSYVIDIDYFVLRWSIRIFYLSLPYKLYMMLWYIKIGRIRWATVGKRRHKF